MQEDELEEGDFSCPPLNDDTSDVSISDFFYYDMEDEDDDMHTDHDSPTRSKWTEKTKQADGDLARDPLDTRNTRSQFRNAFCTCDSNIPERCFLMVGSNP